MIQKILGYYVTGAGKALDAFIVEAGKRYSMLEQAAAPLDEQITDLKLDWQPRDAEFWQHIITILTSLKTANAQCLALLSKEQTSPDAPVPIIMAALSIGYRDGHYDNDESCEEAGIRLTAYYPVCSSMQEAHLRQRRGVLDALENLTQAVQKALNNGRATLAQAPTEHLKLCNVGEGSND